MSYMLEIIWKRKKGEEVGFILDLNLSMTVKKYNLTLGLERGSS